VNAATKCLCRPVNNIVFINYTRHTRHNNRRLHTVSRTSSDCSPAAKQSRQTRGLQHSDIVALLPAILLLWLFQCFVIMLVIFRFYCKVCNDDNSLTVTDVLLDAIIGDRHYSQTTEKILKLTKFL
jgi:hypothetical protein